MQSISHWGQFEIPAAGTDNFKEALDPSDIAWSEFSPAPYDSFAHHKSWYEEAFGPVPAPYDSKYLHGQQDYQLYFNEIPKKSGH